MNIFWKKNKQYFIGLLMLAGFWLSIQYGILGIISEINDKSNLIEEKTLDSENREKRIQELPRLKDQYSSIAEKESDLKVLVKKEEELKLIEMIEKIAEETGNKIVIEIKGDSLASGENKKKDPAKDKKEEVTISPANDNYLSVEVALTGKYNGLFGFIHKIENMRYWSDILSIEANYNESLLSSRGDIFTTGRNLDEKKEGEEVSKKDLNSKIQIIFYRDSKQ